MASISSLYPDNSTLANFRAWGSALSAAITAAGWTQCSSGEVAGQISWAGCSAPATAEVAVGFEVFKTADSGKTTWYLKVEYASGTNVNYPAVWLTLGTAVSTAGVLSGQTSTRIQLKYNTYSTTVLQSCAFAGGTNWLSCSLFYDNTAQCGLTFVIERIKDTDGDDTDTGMAIFGIGSNGKFQQLAMTSGTIWTLESTTSTPGWTVLYPPITRSTATSGNTTGIVTVHPWRQYHYPPVLGAVAYYSSSASVFDVPMSSTISVSLYGTAHTYLALGFQNTIGIVTPAIRYE